MPELAHWPAPTQWEEDQSFGYRQITVFADKGNETRHQLQLESVGWPMDVAHRMLVWCPAPDLPASIPRQGNGNWTIDWFALVLSSALCAALALIALACIVIVAMLVRRARQRRLSLSLALVATVGAFVPPLSAFVALRISSIRTPSSVTSVVGAAAAARGWPDGVGVDWPAPTDWGEWRSFAYRRVSVNSEPSGQAAGQRSELLYQAQVDYLGWPWSFEQETQLLGPREQMQAFQSWTINWPRLLAASALCAAVSCMVAGLTVGCARLLKHWWRSRRHGCPQCHYPIGTSPRCTECGALLPTRTG